MSSLSGSSVAYRASQLSINALDMYSGDTGLNLFCRTGSPDLGIFVVFLTTSTQIVRQCLELDNHWFVLHASRYLETVVKSTSNLLATSRHFSAKAAVVAIIQRCLEEIFVSYLIYFLLSFLLLFFFLCFFPTFLPWNSFLLSFIIPSFSLFLSSLLSSFLFLYLDLFLAFMFSSSLLIYLSFYPPWILNFLLPFFLVQAPTFREKKINPLKTEFLLNNIYIYKFSSYLTGNITSPLQSPTG
jgi:hypothetical protein